MGEEDIHISAWDLKRQYKVCNFGLTAEIRWTLKQRRRSAGLSSEGGDPLITQADLSAPLGVFSSRRTTSQKGFPPQKNDMCELSLSLWLYSYYTQSSPSKNKNINYIFIYIRVLRCLSSGPICKTYLLYYYYDYYYYLQVFHPNFNWLFFTEICVTESLLRYFGLL